MFTYGVSASVLELQATLIGLWWEKHWLIFSEAGVLLHTGLWHFSEMRTSPLWCLTKQRAHWKIMFSPNQNVLIGHHRWRPQTDKVEF